MIRKFSEIQSLSASNYMSKFQHSNPPSLGFQENFGYQKSPGLPGCAPGLAHPPVPAPAPAVPAPAPPAPATAPALEVKPGADVAQNISNIVK